MTRLIVSLAAATVAAQVGSAPAEGLPAVPGPLAHIWQQGVWFTLPQAYLNPPPSDEWVDLLADRDEVAARLRSQVGVTGFVGEGDYDRNLLSEREHEYSYAFGLWSMGPIGRDLRFSANLTVDPEGPADDPRFEPIIIMDVRWAGKGDPPFDYIRRLYFAEEDLGPPPAPGEGIFESIHDRRLLGPRSLSDYRIFETTEGITVSLRCNVLEETRRTRMPQPVCDGLARDAQSGAVLHIVFPEWLATTPGGWVEPARTSFALLRAWREPD